jgi:hypothetical protein
VDEVQAIEASLPNFERVSIAIDDVRCFEQSDAGFPPRGWVANWATAHGLIWIIEHDIFVARSRGLPWIPNAE